MFDKNGQILKESGILPRTFDFIFKEHRRLNLQKQKIKLKVACIEIYKNSLNDLFCMKKKSKKLMISFSRN